MNDGYSICLNKWALDKDIKNELGLLLIISSLCAEKGYCFASNQFFSELFDIDEAMVSKRIKKLENKGYIEIEYRKNGSVTYSRKIRLSKMTTAVVKNDNGDIIINNNINKNIKESNNINIITKEKKINRFKKPTINDIENYAKEKNLKIDAEYFIDYYESKGWLVGKTPMKNWKSAVCNWCRNDKRFGRVQEEPQSGTHFEWVTKDGQVSLERVKND